MGPIRIAGSGGGRVVAKKRCVIGAADDKEQEAGGVGGAPSSPKWLELICAPGDGSLSPETLKRLEQLDKDINEGSSDYEDLQWREKRLQPDMTRDQ